MSRSVAMRLTGHKTEAIYRRYAIVSESDLSDAVTKLQRLKELKAKSLAVTITVTDAHKNVQSGADQIASKLSLK